MKNYPLIKYVIAFIIGIVAEKYVPLSFELLLLSFTLLFLIAIFFRIRKIDKYFTVAMLLIVMVAGDFYASIRNDEAVTYPFEKSNIPNAIIYGEITHIDLMHNNKIKLKILSDSIITKDTAYLIKNNFLCSITLKKDEDTKYLYNQLKIRNKLKLKGRVRKGRGERNPGEFNYYKYLQSKNIIALIYVNKIKNVTLVNASINRFDNTIFQIRKLIAERIESTHNKRTSALLKGLLLADRSEIDYRTKESFINSGVIHVLAVSGLHVGFILLIFMFLLSRISIYPRTALTIIGLVAFLLITNSPASVFRATIMAIVMLLIYLSNRNYNSINALFIAALILLLIKPYEIFNPGFQLSFSAVLSILIIYPILSEKVKTKNKLLRYILLFFAVSLSAQIGTLPFTLIYFHKLSIVALFANIIVIPLIGIVIGLGVLTIFVGTFTTIGAFYFASANMLVTDILMEIVNFAGTLSFSYLFIPNFSIIDGIIFYIFLIVVFYSMKNFSNKFALPILLILVGANLFFFLQIDDKNLLPDGKFSVVMIDIGQGDGILLKFPNNKTALIDAGNATHTFDNGERVIAPLLKRFEINQVDYGFISHVDSDHYKGFLYLIKNRLIKEIYKPRLDTSLQKDVRLEKLIRECKIPLHYYGKSKMDFGNLRLYVLNDTTNAEYQRLDMNNRSGMIKIVHGNNSFLFVGDAEYPAEKVLFKTYGKFLDSDVLKIGHHGSKSSSSRMFVNAVTPNIALISAGASNKFGHPAKIILDRLKNNNIIFYRTDFEGAIILQSDGENIRKINWRNF